MSSVLAYPFPAIPAPATATEVAPGIHWVRMPLPFKLDHINLWLIEDEGAWTLVDTGLGNDATKALWEQLFAGVMDGRPLRRVVATHFHPDHLGLAGWFGERFGCDVWITLGEWLYGRMLCLEKTDAFAEANVAFYRRAGFDESFLASVRERGNVYGTRVTPVPVTFRRISDGEELRIGGRTWRVIVGTGHAPEHACLYSEEDRLLISGDQILPKISPNVSVYPSEPHADPLSAFLGSFARFMDLPADTLVLPSHGLPFRGLQQRIEDLLLHHDDRLAETEAACAQPTTAVELVKVLFRRELDAHQMFFAVGETLAHLHHLIMLERVESELRDGVVIYRRR